MTSEVSVMTSNDIKKRISMTRIMSTEYLKLGFPFSGIFASAQIAQFAAQNFFLRAIPHFLRRDTQTRLRGFARFCAQILRRKTKFLWRGGKFFFAGRKNIIFLLDAKVNIFAGSKSKSFCGHKIRHSIKPY